MYPAFPFAVTVSAWTGNFAQAGSSHFHSKERAWNDAALDGSTTIAAFADNFRPPESIAAPMIGALACEQMP